MKIRLATMRDKEQVLKLFDEFSSFLNAKEKPSQMSGAIFDKLLKTDYAKIFVADVNGIVQGVVTFYIIPNITRGWHRGLIEEFFVSKSVRNHGIGTKLFEYIKTYCQKNNIKVIKLHSSNRLLAAHEFYKKIGGKTTEIFFRFDVD